MLKLRNLCFGFGFLALGYVGYEMTDAYFYQAKLSKQFEASLNTRPATQTESFARPLREGDSLGRIEIVRVGLSAMVEEGVGARTLHRAVGHIPSSPLPGQRGNIALAGHRDTFFRGLRNVQKNDEITLTTLDGNYHYRVESLSIVSPEATEVLNSGNEDLLTLVTCYPFNFIGTAPKRFIVRAHKVVHF
jgi:sortase A